MFELSFFCWGKNWGKVGERLTYKIIFKMVSFLEMMMYIECMFVSFFYALEDFQLIKYLEEVKFGLKNKEESQI